MAIHPQILTGGAARLSLFYAAFFVVIGIQMPFFPVWLEAKGLDARTIGFVLAAPMLVRIVAIPAATRLADERNALRRAMVLGTAGTALGYLTVGLSDGAWLILATYTLTSIAMTPVLPLADAYALRGLGDTGYAYGRVRLWGSVAFIAASLGAGALLDVVAPIRLIWFIAASAGVTVVVAAALAPLASETKTILRRGAATRRLLLRNRAFVAVVLAASLIQASHAVYYGFSALHWRSQGFEGATVGTLWALGVVAEIILFALAHRLPAAVTPTVLLLIGGTGAILRWAVMAFDPPALALPLLQCMHALSFGATHLGAIAFIGRTAPAGLGATAQGYLSVASGTAMAVATGVSGALFEAFGAAAYAAMAASAAAGLSCAVFAYRAAPFTDPHPQSAGEAG